MWLKAVSVLLAIVVLGCAVLGALVIVATARGARITVEGAL